MTSNKQLIESSLKELFKSDKEFICILSGEWGVGKTFFWNELSPKLAHTDKQVYISLFGLNSIQEIKTNILFKISKFKNSTNWLNKNVVSRFKSLKSTLKLDDVNMSFSMETISSLFSLLTQGDFKDIVICFDDIERISNKIEFKDFMGFLSELKEKNGCKVVVILNENELDNLSNIDEKPYSEIFSLYKEKIVDYEFHYKPNVKECFDIAKKLVKVEFFNESILYEFFYKKDIKNIRVIKQCLYYLNQFTFVEELNLDDRLVKNFIQSALTVFYFKNKHNLSEDKFQEFKDYKKKKNSFILQQSIRESFKLKNKDEEESFEIDEQFEKYLIDYDSGIHWDSFEDMLYKYLYSLVKNEDKIREFLLEKNNDSYQFDINEKLIEIEERAIYSLSTLKENDDKEFLEILSKSKKILSKIFSIEDFKKIIDMLDLIVHESKETLKQELLENYIKNIMETQDNIKEHRNNYVEQFIEIYPATIDFIDEYRNNYEIDSDLYSFVHNTIHNDMAFLTKKDEILIDKNRDIIKEEMVKSSKFLKLIIQVINCHTRSSDVKTLKKIFIELKNDENIKIR